MSVRPNWSALLALMGRHQSQKCWTVGGAVSCRGPTLFHNTDSVSGESLAGGSVRKLVGSDVFERGIRISSQKCSIDVYQTLAGAASYRSRVGIVGASKIGPRTLELLRPFDLRLALSDPYVGQEAASDLGAELMPLEDLMVRSDVVSLHAPLLDSTRRMINAGLLARMPRGATLLDVARGGRVGQ